MVVSGFCVRLCDIIWILSNRGVMGMEVKRFATIRTIGGAEYIRDDGPGIWLECRVCVCQASQSISVCGLCLKRR